MNKDTIHLTPRQKEVVNKMQDGWMLMIGLSETTGRPFQQLSKGYENIWFNATLFQSLISKGLIQQQSGPHFDWELTKLGKSIQL